MARALTVGLDQVMLSKLRQPAARLYVFDIRGGAVTMADVVNDNLGLINPLGPTVKHDITNLVSRYNLDETAGDFADTGIASNALSFEVWDPTQDYDPLGSGSETNWFRHGNAIVLIQGDEQVPESEWVTRFTGRIVGQPGADYNRTTGRLTLTMKAQDRAAAFLRQEITSENFGQGTQFLEMAQSFAENDMGIPRDQQVFTGLSQTKLTAHDPTQFAVQTPMTTLAQIGFITGFIPKFLGDGRLGFENGSIAQSPARVYTEDDDIIISVVRPQADVSASTFVTVIGLDADLTKVRGATRLLARASINVGFYADNQTIPVQWSPDETLQAEEVFMKIVNRVDAGLFAVGNEEFFDEALDVTDTEAGSVRGRIEVESGLNVLLPIIVAVTWIALSFVPDNVLTFGLGASSGITISIGRALHAITGEILFGILGTQGLGRYEIWGVPFEFVFAEVRGEAELQLVGFGVEDTVELEIENHLVNSEVEAENLAESLLRREQAKANVRQIRMIPDLRLEPSDIFTTADGRDVFITAIRESFVRGEPQSYVWDVTGFETTLGVYP